MRAAVVLIVLSMLAQAHEPITTNLTWSGQIAALFAQHCLRCHDSRASVPLAHYEQARPWAKAIKQQVLSRQMPPWGAVKGFGDFANDRSLTYAEREMIVDWVEGGAPQGPPLAGDPLPSVERPVIQALGSRVTVQQSAVLSRPLQLAAISPVSPAAISSARVMAQLPDGSLEPLLWLYRWDAKWKVRYLYRNPVALPAGTRILTEPPITVMLFAARATVPPGAR